MDSSEQQVERHNREAESLLAAISAVLIGVDSAFFGLNRNVSSPTDSAMQLPNDELPQHEEHRKCVWLGTHG